jgi:hypothetical protein
MDPTYYPIIISSLALPVSIWTRFESIVNLRNQRYSQNVSKAGESFVAAQTLKNQISDFIDELNRLKNESENSRYGGIELLERRIREMEEYYKNVWDFIKSMELIMKAYEKGDGPELSSDMLEARIAQFNQLRALVEFDAKYIKRN